MTDRTYWIVEDASGEIVNAVSAHSRERAEAVLKHMVGGLHIEEHPPIEKLRRYRYWDERP